MVVDTLVAVAVVGTLVEVVEHSAVELLDNHCSLVAEHLGNHYWYKLALVVVVTQLVAGRLVEFVELEQPARRQLELEPELKLESPAMESHHSHEQYELGESSRRSTFLVSQYHQTSSRSRFHQCPW